MLVLKLFILFILPAGLLWLERQDVKIVKSLSVIVWCYILGFLLNIASLGFDHQLAEIATYIAFPLSLPLLLFEVNLKSWFKLAGPAVKGFFVAVFTSIFIYTLMPLLFFSHLKEVPEFAAMMGAMSTGGTINFSALGVALDIEPNSYIGLYTSEAIVGAIYLIIIFKFSRPILKRFFLPFKFTEQAHGIVDCLPKFNYQKALISLGASIFLAALSAGISFLVFQDVHPTLFIVTLTTLSLMLPLKTKIGEIKESYPIGEYLLYVFCLSLGLMLDLEKLMSVGSHLLGFVAITYLSVIVLHFSLCKLFKIDGHTALITNVAGIFGPPFILPVAKSLNNDAIVMSGLTTSLVGQALGTYIGFLILWLINLLN